MSSSAGKEASCSGKIRAARLSALQFEVLIQFMQQYPHFAVGRANGGSYSKDEHDLLWKTLTATLNETEGPIKSVTKWQKCWVDLKSNARSRAAKYRALSLDGPVVTGTMFTQWDERVLRLLNDIASNGNKFVPVVAQSPLQLLEVGFSKKAVNGNNGSCASKSAKAKFRPIAPKPLLQSQNGYHISEMKTDTMESGSSHEYNLIEDTREADDDVEELIAEVKSEGDDEWPESDGGRCDEDYTTDSMTPRNDPDSHAIRYLHPHLLTSGEELENVFAEGDTSNKRKRDEPSSAFNIEDSLERLSKKLCGTLDRMAAAAEEANAIQHGMVGAMNRLASSFEQLLPVVAKVLSNNLSSAGPS